jgi:predicted GNAT family acetyltransferase
VTAVTAEALELGASPCLFTDAENQGTDALYRSIGYQPIDELLHLDPEKAPE